MRNKRLKFLSTTISFCTLSVCVCGSFVFNRPVQTLNKVDNTSSNELTEEADIPSSMLNISDGIIEGWNSDVNNASLAPYNTLVIPSTVEKIFSSSLYSSNFTASTITNFKVETGSKLDILGGIRKHEYNISSIFGKNFSNIKNIDLSNCNNLRAIENCAFRFLSPTTLESLSLPPNLRYIRDSAFYYLSIPSITFPSSLISIDDGCFICCSNLSTIDLSNCKNLTKIGNAAFGNCPSDCLVKLPSSLEYIGNSAFSFGLADIEIPQTVKYIGNENFGSDATIEPYTIIKTKQSSNSNLWYLEITRPNSSAEQAPADYSIMGDKVYGIAANAFTGATYNSGIQFTGTFTFSSSLTYICDNAFEYQSKISQYLNIPKNLKYIGNKAFYNGDSSSDPSLLSFDLPIDSKLEYIGDMAFQQQSKMESFSFQNASKLNYIGVCAFASAALSSIDLSKCFKLNQIGSSAFISNMSLTEIIFPSSLNEFSSDCFLYDNLNTVFFSWDQEKFDNPYFYVNGMEYLPNLISGATVYIPEGMSKEQYWDKFPDLPECYKEDNIIWSNWTPPIEPVEQTSSSNLLLIIFGSASAALLILMICLAILLSKKKKILRANMPRRPSDRGMDYRNRPMRPRR